MINYLEKNNYGEEDIQTTEEMYLMLNESTTEKTINDYAIHVNTHLKDRRKLYLKEQEVLSQRINAIAKQIGLD